VAGLTPKQERFIAEYLIDLNATAAYKRAGYVAKGNAAEVNASRLLRNAQVQEKIAHRSKAVARKYELSAELVVRSIVQDLTFDPANLYHEDGSLRKVTELDEDTRAALMSVECEQIGSPDAPVYTRKVKWATKQGAREQAMKHLGMFALDNKQRSPLDGVPHELLTIIRDSLKKHLERV
jgi:phage terminase small subunit